MQAKGQEEIALKPKIYAALFCDYLFIEAKLKIMLS